MDAEAMKAQHAWYVRNCARSPEAMAFRDFLSHHLVQLDDMGVTNPDSLAFLETAPEERVKGKTPRQHLQRLDLMLDRYSAAPASDDCFEQNILFARDEFALDPIDVEILLLILRYEHNPRLDRLADEVAYAIRGPRAAAALIGVETHIVLGRLSPGSPLIDQGIITLEDDAHAHKCFAGREGAFGYRPRSRRVMDLPFSSRERMGFKHATVGPPITTPLGWEDFEHLGAERDFCRPSPAWGSARAGGRATQSALLHGPVGTGKTQSFVRCSQETGRAARSGP